MGAARALGGLGLAVVSALALAQLARGRVASGTSLLALALAGRWVVARLSDAWGERAARARRGAWRARLVGDLRHPRPPGERSRGDLALAIEYAAREPSLESLDAAARVSVAGLALVWWAAGPLAAGIVVALGALAVPLYVRSGTRSVALEADYQRRHALLEARQLELLHHAPDLRALGAVTYGADEIGAISDSEHVLALRAIRVALGSSLVTEFLSGVSVGLVAMVEGFALLGGHVSLVRALVAVLVTAEVFAAVRRVGAAFHQREQATDARVRLEALGGGTRAPSATLLAARDLVTSVGGAPLTLEVAPGSRTLVSGPSGSGKTTLLATLVGWRAARAGDVACGARRVGMVSAESALLSATLRENLTLGRDVDPTRVQRLLEDLGLDGPRFADLEVTLLADGRGLSGGERARLVLARCLLADVDLLVLDDVAGVLDEASRARVADLLNSDTRTAMIEATAGAHLLAPGPHLREVRT